MIVSGGHLLPSGAVPCSRVQQQMRAVLHCQLTHEAEHRLVLSLPRSVACTAVESDDRRTGVDTADVHHASRPRAVSSHLPDVSR